MGLTDVVIPQPDDARGGELTGLLGVPEGPGPFVPLVVVHELFGIDDAMRDHLERLRGLGYLVIMPNLFSRGGARRCLVATFRALRGAAARLEAALDARGIDHDVVEYPEAGHAFLNAIPNGTRLARITMGPMLRLGHRPVEADDAWTRIDGFFRRTLV